MPIVLKDSPNLATTSKPPMAAMEAQQRRRMVIALCVLVLALIVVLIKDRQFWFPASPVAEPPSTAAASHPAQAPTTATAKPIPETAAPKKSEPVHPTSAKNKKVKSKPPVEEAPAAPEVTAGPQITATNRTVLPPLEVEVVAGNQHRSLAPNSNPVKVEMQSSPPAAAAGNANQSPAPEPNQSVAAAVNPSAQVSMPPGTARRVTRSVEPDYPTLAKQMKVQGAVVLQALIDRSGNIQDLHVVSGPAILAAAAQEAVKQWHFKPYLQRGKAVETESRITVNFTISTY